jgi:hypothetical protein
VKKAAKLFEEFTGHIAEYVDQYKIKPTKVGLKIGECDGILYTTVRDNKKESYIHKFKKNARPLLVSSFDGQQLIILGGDYDFTNRGIVDRV